MSAALYSSCIDLYCIPSILKHRLLAFTVPALCVSPTQGGEGGGRLTVVGDDAQAIYGFRGSMPGVFTAFKARAGVIVALSCLVSCRV